MYRTLATTMPMPIRSLFLESNGWLLCVTDSWR